MKNFFSTRTLVTSAMLIAISVVLRLLGFPQAGTVRFEFGFLPIAIAGSMYGGIMGGLSYIIADIIGTLLTGAAPLWQITACKFFMGFLFGIFFHKRKISLPLITACVFTIAVIIDLVAMPFALSVIYPGKGIFIIAYERLLMSLVNIPLRIIAIHLIFKYMGNVIEEKTNGKHQKI